MQKLVPQMLELIDSSIEDGIRLLLPFRPVPLERPSSAVPFHPGRRQVLPPPRKSLVLRVFLRAG